MNSSELFSPWQLGNYTLTNRIVMSPMTRSRAIGNVPNELMAKYYSQRASAGLLITEGTSPSPNGLGYSRIPALFNVQQAEGWKKVTQAVHAAGGKIFVQLMHTGRISHPLNMPGGAVVLAPSAVKPAGQMWTDQEGLQDFPVPRAMTADDLTEVIHEFENAASLAIQAGFDGVELHGANGYLLEQFLSPVTNQRLDDYGGNITNRCRYVLEVVDAVISTIGKEKTGIRLSPYGVASDMPHYPEIDETYTYLAEQLNFRDIVYIHLADHSSMGAPEVPAQIKRTIRDNFSNTLIHTGGYNQERAEADIKNKLTDLVGFGRPFIKNPDLVSRLKNHWPLSTGMDNSTLYTPGEKGYTDYPEYMQKV